MITIQNVAKTFPPSIAHEAFKRSRHSIRLRKIQIEKCAQLKSIMIAMAFFLHNEILSVLQLNVKY